MAQSSRNGSYKLGLTRMIPSTCSMQKYSGRFWPRPSQKRNWRPFWRSVSSHGGQCEQFATQLVGSKVSSMLLPVHSISLVLSLSLSLPPPPPPLSLSSHLSTLSSGHCSIFRAHFTVSDGGLVCSGDLSLLCLGPACEFPLSLSLFSLTLLLSPSLPSSLPLALAPSRFYRFFPSCLPLLSSLLASLSSATCVPFPFLHSHLRTSHTSSYHSRSTTSRCSRYACSFFHLFALVSPCLPPLLSRPCFVVIASVAPSRAPPPPPPPLGHRQSLYSAPPSASPATPAEQLAALKHRFPDMQLQQIPRKVQRVF